MNIKKIGLTALAGSMVALSAVAGELTVTGSMNMTTFIILRNRRCY